MASDDDERFQRLMGQNYGAYEAQAGPEMYHSQVGLNNSQAEFNNSQRFNNRIVARAMMRQTMAQAALFTRCAELVYVVAVMAFLYGLAYLIHQIVVWVK